MLTQISNSNRNMDWVLDSIAPWAATPLYTLYPKYSITYTREHTYMYMVYYPAYLSNLHVCIKHTFTDSNKTVVLHPQGRLTLI